MMRGGLKRWVWALWLAISLTLSAAASAQQVAPEATTNTPDYAAWERTAQRAEAAVEAGKASDRALEELRAEIVVWRENFLTAQDANVHRITTLQNQLEVLGPAPQDGAESAEIAARRADLTAELARLQAPVLTAAEAHSRANGVISEIDEIIRERQTDALVALGPSPLNPLIWNTALSETREGLIVLGTELRSNWDNELRRFEFRQKLLFIAPMLLIGLALLLRGRAWVGRSQKRLLRKPLRGADVWGFVLSLGNVALPLAGLTLVVAALLQTGFAGIRGEQVVKPIPYWGGILLMAGWLGDRLFPVLPIRAPFDIPEEFKPTGRRQCKLLALLLVIGFAVGLFGDVIGISDETAAVLGFPFIVLAGLALLRLARFLSSRLVPASAESAEPVTYRMRVGRVLAQIAGVIAVVGPVLAAIGYRNAAEALLYPTVLSIGILGLVLVLQNFVEDLYLLITQSEAPRGEALIPVLIGLLLMVAALPVLALVWGARITDLTELWNRFLEGVRLGGTRISPVDFLTFALIFTIGYVLTRILQGALRSTVLPKTRIDAGGQNAIVAGTGYLGVTIAALIAITGAGIDLSSIAIVAGALSVGIGFGLQNIVSNFVSGIILLIERPVSEGDWIEVGGQMGYVRDISVRSTRIETFDRTDVIIPNADLVSGTVTNYTRGNTVGRIIVLVGVAYGTDTKRVEAILREIAQAHPMILANPEPSILFREFGADSLNFEIRAILRDVNWSMSVTSDLNHEIARRFAEEGIEIPFAQRDIWLRNPEVLRDARSEDDDKGEDA
ncbi:MAG: DUF3772 domain-containing protein [Thalassovita sp.]|nr:DUF3772 domain-containing protein [Thalassovita sp.]